jgi:tRNA threonylcarbamoyladenosine biosynthesis protein TsaB
VLILALDTSSLSGSIALVRGSSVIAERSSARVGTHSEWLMPAIEEMMAASGIAVAEVGAIALSYGPGSFTGLRIGVSIAKGIAWTLGCRIIGVSTLRALALNLSEEGGAGTVAVPLLDARRGEVYSGLYALSGEGADTHAEALMDDSALTVEALLEEIETRGLREKVLFTGDGLKEYGPRLLENVAQKQLADPLLWRVRAVAVAELAQRELLSGSEGTEPIDFTPFYLRKSEAEIKLKGGGKRA